MELHNIDHIGIIECRAAAKWGQLYFAFPNAKLDHLGDVGASATAISANTNEPRRVTIVPLTPQRGTAPTLPPG